MQKSRRVLIADDDQFVADTIVQSLKGLDDCELHTVASGDEACERMTEGAFDVLITDMIMPGLHGLDLIKHVRLNWPDVDVIVMTGYPDDFPYVDVVRAGASDFVIKPHRPAELEAKLLRIVRERDLREAQVLSEQKYRSLFELSLNGMVLAALDDSQIVDANAAFCELVGRSREALLETPFLELLDPFERGRFETGLKLCAASGKGTLGDMIMPDASGRELCLDVSLTFINAVGKRLLYMAFRDVTEKREVDERLVEAAQSDQLTGLLNKRTFGLRLESALAYARKTQDPLTLMCIDLDNFKRCNDTFGHQAGDEILERVGKIINQCIRTGSDEGFRIGGDEFAVLLPGTSAESATFVAKRMASEHAQADSKGTSMSIGIAAYHDDMAASLFLKTADDALYKAKAAGKNTIHVAA